MNKKRLILLTSIFVLGCNDDVSQTKKCQDGEKLYLGQCYDIHACLPECDESTKKCYEGRCYSKDKCLPECDQTNERCVNGECQPVDPNHCEGRLCKNITTWCNSEGLWEACPSGYGCHLGYCINGLAPECENGTCSEDGSRECRADKWIACGSVESCVEGKCTITDEPCEPGTCSEDDKYLCNDDARFEACPPGMLCTVGECAPPEIMDGLKLFQTCASNSDCARGICLFEVAPSRTLSKGSLGIVNADLIAVSQIDSRIEPGMGVCSQDCTRDPSICDDISSPIQQFSCQLAVVGDSPYPPKDDDGMALPLPFHKQLDINIENMETAPYASICRPNDPEETQYSQTFCKTCSTSDDCSGTESCIDNMCLSQCTHDEQCPLFFSCIALDEAMDLGYCTPSSGTCEICLDRDGDGQGYGICNKTGFDCDDLNPNIYYKKPLTPDKCTSNYTDDNCNGHIDYLELIGTKDNCSQCADPAVFDSTCYVPESANHITRECIQTNPVPFDDSTPQAIEETYRFSCVSTCEEGWADCDGDISNGCEVKLFEKTVSDGMETLSATQDGIMYALDEDGDGHGRMELDARHFCCASKPNVCYAMPNTVTNPFSIWEKVTIENPQQFTTTIDDCDDENKLRFPGNPDICDGIDNDCDAQTQDGSASYTVLHEFTYIPDQEGLSDRMGLNDSCQVTNGTNAFCTGPNGDGRIACQSYHVTTQDGNTEERFRMTCVSNSMPEKEEGAQACDGLDNNCDGRIDESYEITMCDVQDAKGICKWGVKICSQQQKDGKFETKPICVSLYQKRDYDFYDDGVDSNCDGEDWDIDKAIYVRSDNNSGKGKDTNPCSSDQPCATLEKALKKAETKVATGKYYYKDVFVNMDVNSSNVFHSGSTVIPTQYTRSRYRKELKDANEILKVLTDIDENGDDAYYKLYYNKTDGTYYYDEEKKLPPTAGHYQFAHVMAYKKKLAKDKDYLNYDANAYQYPLEILNPKEMVRAFGGFKVSNAQWDNGKYKWMLDKESGHATKTTYALTKEKSWAGVHSLLVKSHTSLPLSVRFSNFDFSITSNESDDIDSATILALSCGSTGCLHLTLDNVDINVTGANGLDAKDETIDENWNGSRDAVNGYYANYYDYNFTIYGKNYSANRCLSKFFQNRTWREYTSESSSYYNYKCKVDDVIPHGGCGGYYRCKDYRDSYIARGKDGGGNNAGSGAYIGEPNIKNGCDDDDTVKPIEDQGRPGDHGDGGTGGKVDGASLKLVYNTGTASVKAYNLSNLNGQNGRSGSGGGGGMIYRCYNNSKFGGNNHWAVAGGGGAGGCGGKGGKGGGTGNSAIGLVLTPPDKDNEVGEFDFRNLTLKVTAGKGGKGGMGAGGVSGGKGGKSFGYTAEGGFPGYIDFACVKGTCGGSGGAGGGGGGGAAGLSGHAYGQLFICNRELQIFDTEKHAKSCGFMLTDDTKKSFDAITVSASPNGSSGGDGSRGSWVGSCGDPNSADGNAECISNGGTGGSPGTFTGTTGGTAHEYLFKKSSELK